MSWRKTKGRWGQHPSQNSQYFLLCVQSLFNLSPRRSSRKSQKNHLLPFFR